MDDAGLRGRRGLASWSEAVVLQRFVHAPASDLWQFDEQSAVTASVTSGRGARVTRSGAKSDFWNSRHEARIRGLLEHGRLEIALFFRADRNPSVPKEVIFGTVNRVCRRCSKNPQIARVQPQELIDHRRFAIGAEQRPTACIWRHGRSEWPVNRYRYPASRPCSPSSTPSRCWESTPCRSRSRSTFRRRRCPRRSSSGCPSRR